MSWLNVFLAICASGVALLTYEVKSDVNGYLKEIDRLEVAILEEQERIEVQEAEWAFLNTPSRIDQLAKKYLKLQTPASAQVARFDLLPMQIDPQNYYGKGKPTLLRRSGAVPLPVFRVQLSGAQK